MSTDHTDVAPISASNSSDMPFELPSSSRSLKFKCCACKSTRITERVRFLCMTCKPESSSDYYCHHCVVLHVGQDHHVTDQKGALLDICEKHKNVNMFICETCDLQMFCADCVQDHKNHDFCEIAGNVEKVVDIYKTVHEILANSDGVYKQIVKCLEKIKKSTECYDQLLDCYDEGCMKQFLTEVFNKSLEKVCPEIKLAVNENMKQKDELLEAKELFDDVLTDTSDTQVAMRQVLASSVLQVAKVYSEKLVQKYAEKQKQDRKIPLPYIKEPDIVSHTKGIELAMENLCDRMVESMSEFIRTMRFENISSSVIDVYGQNPGFLPFKKPLENDDGITIASCEAFFLVCCRNNMTGFMGVYYCGSIDGSCTWFVNVPIATFAVASGPNCINITYHATSFYHKTASNNVAISLPGIAWNDMLGTFINASGYVAVINCKQIYNATTWQIGYAIQHGGTIQLCHNKSYPEKPYSFSCKDAVGSSQRGEVNIVCISDNSMHLISISGAVEREHGSLRICCENKKLEHRGRFGCAFIQIETQLEKMFIANWCLECKLVEILKIDTEKGFPKDNLCNGSTRVGKMKLPFDDLQEIRIFKKSCIVVSKQQIFTCVDIFELIELWN